MKWLKVILPLAVILISFLIFSVLTQLRPEVEKNEPSPNYPRIELYTVSMEPVTIEIPAQGTVQPRQQTRITSRVSGHIDWVSPNFYEGGAFREDEVLLKLDPLPYKSALAEANSRLALAKSVYLQELEASQQARRDWETVGAGEPSELVLRIPQLDKAMADLQAAEVGIEVAKDNLSYTEIRAPYNGRVQSKLVEVGQAIAAQATTLGEIFSVDALEIPLAITLDDLSLIPKANKGNPQPLKPVVLLRSSIAGTMHTWTAYLDRTAASIDERTRMISAYARIEPPFTSDNGSDLTPGMFVEARIQGRKLEKVFRVPRAAVQPGNLVYRVVDGNRLESVKLDIILTDADWVIAADNLQPGDRLCMTPLLFFVERMQVDPVNPGESGTLQDAS